MRNPTLPILLCDGYKLGHRDQYPPGTEVVYSNLTPRSSHVPGADHVVFFGLQYLVKEYLQHEFTENFFGRNRGAVIGEYKRLVDTYLGPDAIDVAHIGALHELGYLPLAINAIPEGTSVPLRVPVLTVYNTVPEFFWLTNALETLLSTALWLPITSATTAQAFRRTFDRYERETVGEVPPSASFVPWQGHDFSFRGMGGVEAAVLSGMGHLLSFTGTDTIPAIPALERYYNADATRELIGGSVAATEHSVMCAGGRDDESETFRRLLADVYPTGIVSVVSDTWDFWHVLTDIVPAHRDLILGRDGKLVIRPDSGDPVKIVCGDPDAPAGSPERAGAIQLLWDTFGGTVTDRGYRTLDTHVGIIYGDSINRERQEAILAGLAANGFSSYNVVLGIGSYTYNMVSRDTYGMAMKATAALVNGEWRAIYKDPATDDGTKRSARGLLAVVRDGNELRLVEDLPYDDWHRRQDIASYHASYHRGRDASALRPVFFDGVLVVDDTLAAIRARVAR